MNLATDSEGALGRNTGAGAGAISGAVVGTLAGGPVGTVAGAVTGGMLGAAGGDAAKHMGENDLNRENAGQTPVVIQTPTPVVVSQNAVGNGVPGVQDRRPCHRRHARYARPDRKSRRCRDRRSPGR